MADIWKHRSMSDAIAAKTIDDEASRLYFSLRKRLARRAISALLYRYVQHDAVLVHSALDNARHRGCG
jgi:hypothetical protein